MDYRLLPIHYRGKVNPMKLASSKMTPQGQISVPAKVRRLLGLAPGASVEWDLDGDVLTVKRAVRYSSDDLHRMLFARRPARKSLAELKEGIRRNVRERHARD